MSESNVFAEKDGYSVHFKITTPDDTEKPLATVMKNTELLIEWMKANGYKHDSTKDRGGFGGRQAKPEIAPPSDIPTPQHCGEPMRYLKVATAKGESGKFECRKGQNCQQPREFNGKKFGFSHWEDAYRQSLQTA